MASPAATPPGMGRENGSRRRSAAEWAELIESWERSGLGAAAFARSRGIAATTLSWWKWQLSKRKRDRATPRLVAVEVSPEIGTATDPVWELRTAKGHVLSVHGRLPPEELRSVIAAILESEERE
jgi:hypothetical protein